MFGARNERYCLPWIAGGGCYAPSTAAHGVEHMIRLHAGHDLLRL